MAKRGILFDCDICGAEMESCCETVAPEYTVEVTIPVHAKTVPDYSVKTLYVCKDCWESGFQLSFTSGCDFCDGSGYKYYINGKKPCECGGPDRWDSRRRIQKISKNMEAKCLTR